MISRTTSQLRTLCNPSLRLIPYAYLRTLYKSNTVLVRRKMSTHSNTLKNDNPLHLNTIAVAQMTSGSNEEMNYQAVERMVKEVKERGACMLFLPECFHFMGDAQISTVDIARPMDTNVYLDRYRKLAKDYKLWLSLGGYPIRSIVPTEDTTGASSSSLSSSPSSATKHKVYNSHIIINNEGDIQATYAKIHLFDINKAQTSNLPTLLESSFTVPGDTLVRVRETPIGSMGLSICYDVRFPLLYNSLVFAPYTTSSTATTSTAAITTTTTSSPSSSSSPYPHQCSVLLIPAAFTVPTGKVHWETLLRTRAIENQCYVIAAAQVGKHNTKPGRTSWGHSMIIDPWGTIVAEGEGITETSTIAPLTNESSTPYTILYAAIDPTIVQHVRSSIPLHEHLRPSIYTQPVQDK